MVMSTYAVFMVATFVYMNVCTLYMHTPTLMPPAYIILLITAHVDHVLRNSQHS